MNLSERQLLKLYITSLYEVQKLRIQISNRVEDFKRRGGETEVDMAEELKLRLFDLANKMEKNIAEDVAKAVAKYPVMRWLEKVNGIGPRLGGSLVGTLQDISNYPNVSSLWAYCGMGVITVCSECKKRAFPDDQVIARQRFLQTQIERRWRSHCIKEEIEEGTPIDDEFSLEARGDTIKALCSCDDPDVISSAPSKQYYSGLLLDYNPFLRMTCWKISNQFVKQGKYYRQVYVDYKEYYTERDGGRLTKGHINNRALRAVVKLFLSHLYYMWSKSEGINPGQIYLQFKLGDEEFDKTHSYKSPPFHDMFD